MFLLLTYANKLIKILNDKASPGQIAGAVALGAIVGLLPGFTLLSLAVFIVIFLVNVNLSAAFFAVALFKPVGYILDPLAHRIGLLLLVQTPPLQPVWTSFYNMPFVPFTRFNNTVVLGNLVLGVILFVPVFFAIRRGVIVYRERYRDRINRLKIVQMYKASQIYQLYQKVRDFQGG